MLHVTLQQKASKCQSSLSRLKSPFHNRLTYRVVVLRVWIYDSLTLIYLGMDLIHTESSILRKSI